MIIQDDAFEGTASVILCAFTTDPTEAPLFRIVVEPDDVNRLSSVASLMVDKITTIPRARVGSRVGRLADEDMVRLNRAVVVFLGISGRGRPLE